MDYIVLISPAKRLNLKAFESPVEMTQGFFSKDAKSIVSKLKDLEDLQLQKIMDVNSALLEEVKQMLSVWGKSNNPEIPAAAMYNGDAYLRLEARLWDQKTWAFAQDHLAILSAVYGVSKATDAIQPYRLMVGAPWKWNGEPSGLYSFWKGKLVDYAKVNWNQKKIINLASLEYAEMLSGLQWPILNLDFKVKKKGKLVTVSSFSKQARGAAARLIMENRWKNLDTLKKMDILGFRFDPTFSDKENWIFVKE